MNKWLSSLYYSYPIQLLILHIRSYHLLLLVWFAVGLLLSGQIGQKLGIQYLFLAPEYMGNVNFWSFFFVGLGFGGFFMSWNLTIYLLSSQYFPFLASLGKPFTKFSINNGLIPMSFFLFYLGYIVYFQSYYEQFSSSRIWFNCLGLLLGTITIILFYIIYFQFTNRDISYYRPKKQKAPNQITAIAPGHRKVDIDYIKKDDQRWKVKTYLNEYCQTRIVRSVAHYDSKLLKNIFKQNHLNALITQLISMTTLVILGYLIDLPFFRIPAGASIFIMVNVFIAVIGAITYWFDEWRMTVMILMLIGINFLTSFELFHHTNKAYGLDYYQEPKPYSYEALESVYSDAQIEKDKNNTNNILSNWKDKQAEEKPKMVILSVSGGGLKSAVWVMNVVQQLDSLSGGKLLDHTVLITGASGGMIGMGYMRELYLQKQLQQPINIYDQQYIDHISKDLLNSLAFTIVSNDLFVPWSKFKQDGFYYHKDRGYIFEQQLNENTHYLLDKQICDYKDFEADATIPMLYLTPSIVNDARRLFISPQGVSFMMMPPIGVAKPKTVEIDAVDFNWMFDDHGSRNLRFTTALRMNATYPYILPNVHLPSQPEIEVMDAGFLDNYGILAATRFLQVFKDWIKENTSGVMLVQISSSERIEQIQTSKQRGIVESILNPLGIAGKVLALQEFEHDNNIGFMYDLLGDEYFEIVRFIYSPPTAKNQLAASVSFHITEREKKDIKQALYTNDNQSSLRQVVDALQAPTQPFVEK